jgi:hypothetical protein
MCVCLPGAHESGVSVSSCACVACLIRPEAFHRLCVTDHDPCFSLSVGEGTAARLKQADEQKKKQEEEQKAAAAPQPPQPAYASLRTRVKHVTLQEEIRAAWATKAAAQQLWVCRVCDESVNVAKQSGSALLPQCVHMICGRCAHTQLEQQHSLHCNLCDKGTANAAIHGPHLAADALGPEEGKQTTPPPAAAAAAAAVRECADCSMHDESIAAMFECGQCKKDYCEAHAKAHAQMSKYAAHALTAVAGAGVVLCGAHGHVADAYCHSCETPVCNVCMAANGPHPHATHHITVPDEAYMDKTRARVAAAMAEAAQAMADVAKYGADARLTLDDLARRDASLTDSESINKTFDSVVGTVNRRREHVLADLQAYSDAEAKAVGDLDVEQYARWVRLQSVSAACTQVFTAPPAALAPRAGLAMAQLETRALEGLRTLTAEAAAPGLAVPLLAPLSFRLGVSRDAEEALYAALQQMGQLVLDPAAAAAEAAAQRAREEHEGKEEEERRKKAQGPPVTQPKPTARK